MKHAAALDLRLRGYSWRRIGAELDIDKETARGWSLSPKWQREAERRRAAIEAAEIEERRTLRAAAWERLSEILDRIDGDPRVLLEAVKTTLDRTGVPAGAAVDVRVSGEMDLGQRSDEELLNIIRAAASR